MLRQLAFCSVIITSLTFFSCSEWLGNDNENLSKKGNVLVAVSLGGNQNPNAREARATKHTKLILQILDNMENALKDTTVNADGNLILCDMGKFSTGDALKIIAWTENESGIIIHSPDTQTVVADENESINVGMVLQPRVGSIIARFAGVPTTVDSLFMAFDSDSGAFETKIERELHSDLSLDNVPYGATGMFSLEIRNKDKSYLVDWDTTLTFKRENISLEYSFSSDYTPDGINISVVVENPFNTIITGIADSKVNFGEETNAGIVITEFSYNYGSGLNFVEIANLSQDELAFEELSVEIIGSNKTTAITNNITLSPQEILLFTNEDANDFWAAQENVFEGNIHLVSTGSIIIIRGDGIILDYVFYSDLKKIPARTSVRLLTTNSNPEFNNIPSNWDISTDRFTIDSNDYYGNPGEL